MEKIIKQKTILLVCVILLLTCQKVFAYTGNVISSGAFLTNTTQGSEIREMVTLKRSGSLLLGKPKHSAIKLVTIYAPDIKESKIIIRELPETDGKISLFLSVPQLLEGNTKRISLFLDQEFKSSTLLEAKDNTWVKHQGYPIQVSAGNDQSTQNSLIAFSTQKTGAYWLIKNGVTKPPGISSNEYNISANALLSGDKSRSFMAIGLAFAIFSVAWKISSWHHARTPK